MAHRPGFVVPNAGDTDPFALVSNRQAEPDAGDFSVLGNGNYGVLTGFNYVVTSGTFQINTASTVNVGLVAGTIYRTQNLSVALTPGGAGDRFDLVVFAPLTTDSNKLQVIQGTQNENPKFPDIPANTLLLAAVWLPANVAVNTLTLAYVIDKRAWLLNGARGAVDATSVFVENQIGGTDSTFKVLGSGTTRVGSSAGPNVTFVPYSSSGPKFDITGGDDGTGAITEVVFKTPQVTINGDLALVGDVSAGGQVSGSNLIAQSISGTPSNSLGQTGTLFQDTQNGRVYVKRPNGQYAEIYADEYPPGTVISTLLTGQAAADYLTGSWLQCNGQAVPAANYPRLAAAFPTWVAAGVLTVPDLRDSFLGSGIPVGTFGGSNQMVLQNANLPPHTHLSAGSTNSAGSHNHGTNNYSGPAGTHSHTMPLGGQHAHHINDPGHVHQGADHGYNIPSPILHMAWGGAYKVDTLNVDADHGPNVDFAQWTVPASVGITATDNDGLHSHPISAEPDHTHALNLSTEQAHTHLLPAENPVGSSAPVENRPKFYGVNWYIKA